MWLWVHWSSLPLFERKNVSVVFVVGAEGGGLSGLYYLLDRRCDVQDAVPERAEADGGIVGESHAEESYVVYDGCGDGGDEQ